jgi:cytochrome b subunit of formate dehydrogenase
MFSAHKRFLILGAGILLLGGLALLWRQPPGWAKAPAGRSSESAGKVMTNADCFACHEDVPEGHYASSAHGGNLCISCHNDIRELPHPEKLNKVQCANCHRIEAEVYNSSDHGKAVQSNVPAATCTTCHGASHVILSSRNPESPVYRLNIPKTCAVCHEDEKKMGEYNLLEKMPLRSYSQTVHGTALSRGILSSAICTDCHGSHDLHAPSNPKSKIYKRNVPATCGKCHENDLKIYERSIHGKAAMAGKREAPVCTDCHGEHVIKSHKDPTSLTYTTAVSEKVCGQCHAAEKVTSKYRLSTDRVKTYLESYHGIATKMGSTTTANCASCHGYHDILPPGDPLSSVNKNNLPRTCGKCHPKVSEQLAKGSVHLSPSPTSDTIIFYVTCFYILLIVLTIGGMLFHNVLDFLKKLREHYEEQKARGIYLRFSVTERIQHFVLALSFVVLAYTGFALKWPDAWWAAPFAMFEKGFEWRGQIHRIAAAVFCALCVFHGIYVFFTQRGRGQLRALLPVKKDFTDVILTFGHNLSLTKKKPVPGRYGYVEKAEYWALVWGTVVMVVTGALLMFENLTMRYFPKWVLDVALTIHFYEAVLATLAILVWHFYFTIFDPEHYPIDLSMTTGMSPEKHPEEDRKEGKDG